MSFQGRHTKLTYISICMCFLGQISKSSLKGYTAPTQGNVPICFRKLIFAIAQKMITSTYTASSHLRRQGEMTLTIHKINTYCHHKEPWWLYVYMTVYIFKKRNYFFIFYFFLLTNKQANPNWGCWKILGTVLSYKVGGRSCVSHASRSIWLDICTGHL